jgi:hypothetical protein
LRPTSSFAALPSGIHRICHYGLFAGALRADNIERVRQLLDAAENAPQPSRPEADSQAEDVSPARRYPCCGGRMIIVEMFEGPRPAIAMSEPDQDQHLMTVATHPSHRRSSLRPAARRNTSAMSARSRQSSFHRCERLASAHRRHRKRPPSPLPMKTPSAADCRRLARQPSAILKSP